MAFFRQSGLETMADVDDGESFIRMCLSPSPANSVEQVTHLNFFNVHFKPEHSAPYRILLIHLRSSLYKCKFIRIACAIV